MTIQELKIKIDKLFPYTDKRIEIAKSQKDENYIKDLFFDFYNVINEMIIHLQDKDLDIYSRLKFEENLPLMTKYFFDNYLEKSKIFIEEWEILIGGNYRLKDKDGIYITYKDFTKENVFKIIESLNIKSENKTSKQEKTKEDYINIAYLIAEREDFTVSRKPNRKGIEEIIKGSSYKFNSKDDTIAINTYSTINNDGTDKSLFKKSFFEEIHQLLLKKYQSLENIPNREFANNIKIQSNKLT